MPQFGHRGLGGPARRAVFGTSVGHLAFFDRFSYSFRGPSRCRARPSSPYLPACRVQLNFLTKPGPAHRKRRATMGTSLTCALCWLLLQHRANRRRRAPTCLRVLCSKPLACDSDIFVYRDRGETSFCSQDQESRYEQMQAAQRHSRQAGAQVRCPAAALVHNKGVRDKLTAPE